MKAGTRLKSSACDTEVVVIRAGDGALACGGASMSEAGATDKAALADDFAGGTIMGKRYVDADGAVELLCVKPGKGTLAYNGVALAPKEAKPLPASD